MAGQGERAAFREGDIVEVTAYRDTKRGKVVGVERGMLIGGGDMLVVSLPVEWASAPQRHLVAEGQCSLVGA